MDGSLAPLPSNGVPPGGTIASGAGSGYLPRHAVLCEWLYPAVSNYAAAHVWNGRRLSVGAMLTSSVLRAILPRFAPLGR